MPNGPAAMTLTKGAQAALLKWVNTFEGLDRRADSLDDLKDGVVLAQVLRILNPDFDRSSLNPNATSWLEKKRNLEIVYRALAQFLRQENPYLAPSPTEFRNIVDNPDATGMCEFLSAFVSAACLGELAPLHVPAIMKMDRPDQREIMAIIQRKQLQIQEAERRAKQAEDVGDDLATDGHDDPYNARPPPRDPDLEREAEIARLSKELDTVRKQNADLLTRNEQLQMSREEVVEDLQLAQREIDVLRKTNESDASAIIRKLEQEKREEEHLIDTLQAQAEDDRLEKIRLRNEVDHFKSRSEQASELEDRVKELEHERDSLSSKLKQAEWYKKSAEQAKITDLKNRELESQNHELRDQIQELDRFRAENETLNHTCQQYRKQMGTYESEKFEDQEIKASLKEENETLKHEKQILADQLRIGEDQIRDLQERLQIHVPESVGSVNGAAPSSNLELELETTADPAVKYRLEISRLEAENKLLRNNMGVTAENERLRSEIEFEKQKLKAVQERYADVNTQHILAQEQIKALLNTMEGDRDQAFQDKKTKLAETISELERQRAQVQKLESEMADKNRELLAARIDRTLAYALNEMEIVDDLSNNLDVVTAVSQQSVDAVEILKRSDELISASLTTELDSLREKLRLREVDLEQLRDQLTNALVSKDKLYQQLESVGITAIPLKPSPDGSGGEGDGQKPKSQDSEKNEKLKAALKQKLQQLEKAELDKYELQRRLKALENGGVKSQYDQIIKNLKRENAMMSAAWHDLTRRLQSNHVVLQRRHDVPKSWLNKQRQMANSTTTPRR